MAAKHTVHYAVEMTSVRSVWDDVLEDDAEQGITFIEAKILALHVTTEASGEVKRQWRRVGSVSAMLTDPDVGNSDILEQLDMVDPDVPYGTVYNSAEGGFCEWWDVDAPFGRVLWILSADVSKNRRGLGLSLLAIRRLVQTYESNMVVMFVDGGTAAGTKKLQRHYRKLGFRKLDLKHGVLEALAGEDSFQRAFQSGAMYLDPANKGPVNSFWKPARRS